MRRVPACIHVAALLLALMVVVPAASQAYSIYGRITVTGRADQGGVTVWVDSLHVTQTSSALTYQIEGLEDGTYTVHAWSEDCLARIIGTCTISGQDVVDMDGELFAGDLLADGRINLHDSRVLLDHYLETPDSSGWDDRFDVIIDDIIDSHDIDLIASHWRESADSELPVWSLEVVEPGAATIWDAGQTGLPIRWITGNLGGMVSIDLSRYGSKVATLTGSTENDGEYTLAQLPAGLDMGDGYRVYIFCDETHHDMGEYFSIVNTMMISTPNSGTTWFVGEQDVTIEWDPWYEAGDVSIFLMTYDSIIDTIASSIPNDGIFDEYDVPVSVTPGGGYRIEIVTGTGYSAGSDNFGIRQPLEVYNPDSSRAWWPDGYGHIEWWNRAGSTSPVSLYLYKGDVFSHTIVEGRQYDLEFYGWTVPEGLESDDDYRVKASYDESPEIGCFSEHFHIRPRFQVFEPNSSTVWMQGQENVTIWWETADLGGTVTIKFLRGDAHIDVIAEDTPNDGFYDEYDLPYDLPLGDYYRVEVYYDEIFHASGGNIEIVEAVAPENCIYYEQYLHMAGFCDTPGSARGVAVSGSYVYIADYTYGLQVVYAGTAGSPLVVGSVDTPGEAVAVAVSGSFAYVADSWTGLQILDISSPGSPVIVGSIDTPGSANDVDISGDYAYVADRSSGLQIIDISTPGSPVISGSIDTPESANDVTVSGDLAFIADGYSGLQIIDISPPESPVIIGSTDTPGVAYGVAVSGDFAYVADWNEGLQVIDIGSPESPVIVGSVYIPGAGPARKIKVSGYYAYVAVGGVGFRVIDIRIPESPVLMGVIYADEAYGVASYGDRAWLAAGTFGPMEIRVRSPQTPEFVGSVETPGTAKGIAISGDYACVADGNSLQIIDVSVPGEPVIEGFLDMELEALDVAVQGDHAFVANYTYGLQVIDISAPGSLAVIGSIDTPGAAYSVVIDGNYAYVADYTSGLQVIDISTPGSPSIAGSVDTPGYAKCVAVSPGYAYMADGNLGLQIIDIGVPGSPFLAGSVDTPGDALGVAVSGNHVFVADRFSGLQVIDISNPHHPEIVGSIDTPGGAYGVAVSGDYAYVADYGSGLQVIDISTFASPFLTGSIDTPDNNFCITISGEYGYMTGLYIVNLQCAP